MVISTRGVSDIVVDPVGSPRRGQGICWPVVGRITVNMYLLALIVDAVLAIFPQKEAKPSAKWSTG